MTASAAGVTDQRFGAFRLGYRPSFDGLRAIFVLLVVGFHATYFLVPKYAGLYVPGGFIGVDAFFVLSGFLITSLLLQEWDRHGRISLRTFYRRRALRLFPALWTIMIVQLIYALIVHEPLGAELKGLAAIFFYVGNISGSFKATPPLELQQTWSLAIEEQFYLVWPLVLIVLIRLRNRRVTITVMCGLIAVALVFRALLWNAGVPWLTVYTQTEARVDTLMVGALFAYLLHTGSRVPRGIGIYAAAAALFLAVVIVYVRIGGHYFSWLFDGGYTVVALACGLVILGVLDQRLAVARVLSTAPFRLVGRLSYSIYLWHALVFVAIYDHWSHRSNRARSVAGFCITAVASVLSYYLIELPFLRRKRSPSAPPEGAPRLAPPVPSGP
jgi:peptidoglycan/LPS O-acetylase OafA/YrhL